ncbi:MAG: branched-chain amino acid ABC transporter substrate-binding protein, partial [Desulfobacteraceae bacterium]|nr:branched-chain amino acid ABC transporter substrate-binding protein [Desulfobacteraceae bacterium]
FSGENPNFFRTISYDGAQAVLMTQIAIEQLKVKKVALIHDKGDYGRGQMELVKASFEKKGGVEVVLFEGVTTGAVDYTAIVQKIKRSKADVTLWGGYHSDASKIVQLLVKKRVKTTFFGGDGIIGDNFTTLAGKYSEGVYATGPDDTSSNPLYQALLKKHQKKYSEDPGTFCMQGYACIQALAKAAEKAGSLDYDKMRAALLSQKVDTPLGKIGFDKRGDVVGVGFSAYKVIDGKYKQIN